MSRKEKSKMSNKTKIVFVVIAIILIIAAAIVTVHMTQGNKPEEKQNAQTGETGEPAPVEEKKVQIYSGNARPIAVMIDNNTHAWPQAGINDAYIVYEMIVEGGETRLMALFKGVDLEKIGPVRSSRHNFLDYALENDAIYVHYGWSPKAQSDISTLKVNNINGISESNTTFWRDSSKSAPHNAVTTTKKILESANKKNYRTTSDAKSVLNYTTDEVELTDGMTANTVKIPYSGSANVVSYTYNPETKTYTRYSKSKKQKEWNTGNDVTTKNIIITLAKNGILNGADDKGRQDIQTVGKLNGYYITNGKAIKITCEKTSRTGKTVYRDLNGNEIKVNDGNTFIQICPINANITIE